MYNWIVQEQDDMPRNVTAALVGTAVPLIEAWRVKDCVPPIPYTAAHSWWHVPASVLLLGLGLSALIHDSAPSSLMVHIADGMADAGAAIIGQRIALGIGADGNHRAFVKDEDALAG